jgi:hypothetical protein
VRGSKKRQEDVIEREKERKGRDAAVEMVRVVSAVGQEAPGKCTWSR